MAAPDLALTGKVAIVTGGSKGLGRAMTIGLVRAGAQVAATGGHDRAALASAVAVANELSDNTPAIAISADVTSDADCRRVVEETIAAFGGIDILVNNAGIGMRTISETFLTERLKFWEADADRWRAYR